MSNEFYRSIAKRLYSYLVDTNPEKGTRYWLRLDSQEMVDGIDAEMKKLLQGVHQAGTYTYTGKSTYTTYTLEGLGADIVFAAQRGGMETDFLATLRNRAGDEGFVIVSLTTDKSDTVDTATKSLSDPGMPFHRDSLKGSIEGYIARDVFSPGERAFLRYGLKHMEEDRFSDRSSVSSYETFLTILERNRVEDEDFVALGMFPDIQGLKLCTSHVSRSTKERFDENSDLFESVSRAFNRDDIKGGLEGKFKGSFIKDLVGRKTSGQDWKSAFTYDVVRQSQKRDSNVVVDLSPDAVEAVALIDENLPGEVLGDALLMKCQNEKTAAGRRKRHIIACVPSTTKILQITFKTTSKFAKGDVSVKNGDADASFTQSRLTVKVRCDDRVTFSHVTAQKNQLYMAVFKTDVQYFEGIETKYEVSVGKKRSEVVLNADGGSLTFNKTKGAEPIYEDLVENGAYSCYEHQRFTLNIDEDLLDDAIGNIPISVSLGGCDIPCAIRHNARSATKLDAFGLYREKNVAKRSFSWMGEQKLQLGTLEYAINSDAMTTWLRCEQDMVGASWLSATLDGDILDGRPLSLPQELADAYHELYAILNSRHICLSLAYAGDPTISPLLEAILKAYEAAIRRVKVGDYNYEDLLEIGVIYGSKKGDGIWLTPLHPLNIAYQLNVVNLGPSPRDATLTTPAFTKLHHNDALPYLRHDDTYYEPTGEILLPEWVAYRPVESELSRSLGDAIPKIVHDRIYDYVRHFGFLFSKGTTRSLKIACYELGTCEGVFLGIADYLLRELYNADGNADSVIHIHVDCYGDPNTYTAFENLLDFGLTSKYLEDSTLLDSPKRKDLNEHECVTMLVSHLSFSAHKADAERRYSHLAFAPGASKSKPQPNGKPEDLNTGLLLNGAIVSAPTTESDGWFKSGFGSKGLARSRFNDLALAINMLHSNAYTQNGYREEVISAAVSQQQESRFDDVYATANWVVMLDPKVDPIHFAKMANGESKPLVIHYEDRETTAGCDAITVTQKTSQYEGVIATALGAASHGNLSGKQRYVIDFANAFNGTWLLSFLERNSKDQTPRSRMSMLAAARAAIEYYDSDDIVWVPLSLEEMLRVSNGLRLSSGTEINSGKNLGLKGSMADDVLLVGVKKGDSARPQVVLHPVEVKVGGCTSSEIEKGCNQASQTYDGLMGAWWGEEHRGDLPTKVARNAFMQRVITAAEKMDAYGVLPSVQWKWVTDDCKTALQNENYELLEHGALRLPKGTVCAFSSSAFAVGAENHEDILVLTIPEPLIPEVTTGDLGEVAEIVGRYDFGNPAPTDEQPLDATKTAGEGGASLADGSSVEPEAVPPTQASHDAGDDGIKVLLGKSVFSGRELCWEPNNTDKLFHTNTGIIGTMGTGKTQFTKSLIAQLYAQRACNPGNGDLGILIFDYKGDYNAAQEDFLAATNAKVYQPYHLPFNPLSINRAKQNMPLLPRHVANTFKDTLVRACSASKLGAVQENTLYRFIMDAYELKQIIPGDPTTWDREPPTFETVYRLYDGDEDTKKNDSLASILEKIHEFEIFEGDPKKTRSLYDALEGVVVIDLSGYDPDLQNLVVGIMVDLFYSQMHAKGHSEMHGSMRELTKMILVDEADNFLSQGFPSLKKILKEGREFGVGTILSTQFLKHFRSKDEDYSKYILTWVVHNVADLDPSDIRFVFNTEAKSAEEVRLFNEVKKLGKHQSLLKMGERNRPETMRDWAFWEYWENLGKHQI